MSISDSIQLVALLVLIILSGFFSKAETAYTGVSRVRIRALADEQNEEAVRVLKVLENYSRLLSSILIGNNIVNLSASALATSFTIQMFGNRMVGFSTGIITFLVLIFGEIVPKRQAAAEPEKYALKYSAFMYVFVKALTPLVWLTDMIARGIAFLFHLNVDNAETAITEEELKTYVEVSHEDGAIESDEMQLIHNVFDFGDAMARDIMIPRLKMETVDSHATYHELLEVFRRTMFTRIPVYKNQEDPDNIIGFVNIKDMVLVEDESQFVLRNLIREAHYTTETKRVSELMTELKENRLGLAFVINEYGETVGMITMEDMLEELVGDIRDEYDSEEEEKDSIRRVHENQYLIDASVSLTDINDTLETEFDSENYNSLAGIMLEKLNRIPKNGDSVTLEDGTVLRVQSMKDHRIIKIMMTLGEKEKSGGE